MELAMILRRMKDKSQCSRLLLTRQHSHLSRSAKWLWYIVPVLVLGAFSSCGERPEHTSQARNVGVSVETQVVSHPSWSTDAVLYEASIRQHTPEGTFVAFEKDVARLYRMGVRVIVLTPIQPVGIKNRQGKLGNPYAVRNYFDVRRRLGSMDEFQSLVASIHSYGMKVIIDWVGAQTAIDCLWRTPHSDFYFPLPSDPDEAEAAALSDVAMLNYENTSLHEEMLKALKFWVDVADVDGFRCVDSELVPLAFWSRMREELLQVKPGLLFIADAENPKFHEKAFDATYCKGLTALMDRLAAGELPPNAVNEFITHDNNRFVSDAYRISYTTTRNRTPGQKRVFERLGPAEKTLAVLAFTLDGMPLICGGQESGDTTLFNPFDKQSIQWGTYENQEFYTKLIEAKKVNKALWNGMDGGIFRSIKTSEPENVLAFSRTSGQNSVIVVLNLSGQGRKIRFQEAVTGEHKSIFNKQTLSVFTESDISLGPWGYQVFSR